MQAQGDYTAARQSLGIAITQAPLAVWPRLVLSDVLLREGKDLKEAEIQLQEALTLDPKQALAQERLKEVQQRRQAGT